MRVGFYHAARGDERPSRARIRVLVQSVQHAMPGVEVVHFTDLTTQPVAGVDDVIRRNVLPIATARIDAYAAAPDGDWLYLDTDIVVQADVSHVFQESFDISLADRRGTLRPQDVGTKCVVTMPFNSGAVFSRSPAFWLAALARVGELSEKRQGWMGDQVAMCDVIASKAFDVKVLDSRYNYPPHRADEDVSDKFVLHYKGRERKVWMLDRQLAGAA